MWQSIKEILTNSAFSTAGNWSSIIGLILTIMIFINIKKIKGHYIFLARVPELIERLNTVASEISRKLNEQNFVLSDFYELLIDAETTLVTLKKKVSKDIRKDAIEIIKKINLITKRKKNIFTNPMRNDARDTSNQDQVQIIYRELYRIRGRCNDEITDAQWSQSA